MDGNMNISQLREPLGRHAIVIGAGMSGLAVTKVLADHYREVTLIERDSFSRSNAPRKGVPQGRHAHGLLARGREALESLFPGISDELVGKGALDGDLLADSLWFNHGVYLRQADSGLAGLLLSRPLLETHVGARLLQCGNVRVIDRCQVTGLTFDKDAAAIIGVELKSLSQDNVEQTLAADLVVDTTGRGSQSATWLANLGYAAPPEQRVEVGISYTTRSYRRQPGQLNGNRVVAVRSGAPDYRFGVALAQEENRWIVTLGGYFGDTAPADDEAFAAFARSMPAAELHTIITTSEALSPFCHFRFPASIRRHYEQLRHFPSGYLVCGDALCSFNPSYGQGMTTALVEAEILAGCLASGPARLAERFFAKAARVLDTPWQIAVGNDLANPNVNGTRTLFGRFFGWYIEKLHQAAAMDAELAIRFIKVANLMAPPTALLRPATALRVFIGNLPRARRMSTVEALAGAAP
jgi:2-polyprenyl-6-methoxyphenol hydroxylase-like FAD-dependent oxidoreductase